MMNSSLKILVLFFLISLASCSSSETSRSESANTSIDSSLVASSAASVNENETAEENPENTYAPGNSIDLQNANYFLSSMLYHSVAFHSYTAENNSLNVKLMKNRFNPVSVRQDFNPEYALLKCGTYIEGPGALKQILHMSFDTGEDKGAKSILEELSGLPFTRTTEHSQPFDYVNPQMIDWCWRNFYRSPNSGNFTDVSQHTLYDVIFKKFIRTLVVAHVEIIGHDEENEKNWYRNSVIMEKGHAPELLRKRYIAPEKYTSSELNTDYYPLAAGFWLRRSIDESGPVLWHYIRSIVLDYDYEWGCKYFQYCDRG